MEAVRSVMVVAVGFSGGAWIFALFLVIGFAAVVFSYFSERGTDIRFRAWNDSQGGAPGALGFGNAAGKDPSQDVRNWTRGTSARRRRNIPVARTAEELEARTDADLLPRLVAWRARMNAPSAGLTVPPNPERDHTLGAPDAPLVLVQYTDFECPSCQSAAAEVGKLRERLGDRLLFVLRHFPIADAHVHAVEAAEAVEAAGAQGRFWELHDRIYSRKRPPTAEDLRAHARKLGLDLDRFERDMREHVHVDRVREDFESGLASGVNGTPCFFVGGERYDGTHDAAGLSEALVAAAARVPA